MKVLAFEPLERGWNLFELEACLKQNRKPSNRCQREKGEKKLGTHINN